MTEDVTYRVDPTKAYIDEVKVTVFAVSREVQTPNGFTSNRVSCYRKRSTAQAVAAVLGALADQEV